MKHVILASVFLISAHALAGLEYKPYDKRELWLAPAYPNGTGTILSEVRIESTQKTYDDYLHWVEFNTTTKKVTRMNLPKVTTNRACNFYRKDGGSIGDYKPKNILEGWQLSHWSHLEYSDFLILKDGNAEYNETPVVFKHNSNPLRDRITDEGIKSLYEHCKAFDYRLHLKFFSEGLCRWKPENWHKPENFPWEIDFYYPTETFYRARLICVK